MNTPATLLLQDASQSTIRGALANLSANGVLFSTAEKVGLPEGAAVTLSFQTTVVRGEVRHIAAGENDVSIGIAIRDAEYQTSESPAA